MDESSGVVSFTSKKKSESEPIYYEDQWQETVMLDQNEIGSEKVWDRKMAKEDEHYSQVSSDKLNKTLGQFQTMIFSQMDKQQMFMENVSVGERGI